MRVVLIALAAALAAAQAPAQAPLQPAGGPAVPPQPETRRPIIVDTLAPAAAAPVPAAAPAAAAVPVVNGRPAELVRLEDTIKRHQESLEAIGKQLEEGLHQKKRLIVAQKLLESIIHLKRAERLLGNLDARVEAAKANIKKFGEQADEIADSIKASEVAHRKELADLNKKLVDLRASLGQQEKVLATLVAKRGRIASTVSKWKDHVATLHDAHEALTNPRVARRKARGDDFPEPPPAGSVLSSLGVAAPARSSLRGKRDTIDQGRFAALRDEEEAHGDGSDEGRFAAARDEEEAHGDGSDEGRFAAAHDEEEAHGDGSDEGRFAAAHDEEEAHGDGSDEGRFAAAHDEEEAHGDGSDEGRFAQLDAALRGSKRALAKAGVRV